MVAHMCVIGGRRDAAGTDVVLDVDVEDQSLPRHPVRLVSGAQGREPLWCAGSDHGRSVRRPPDLGIDHPVDLTNEVLVRLLRLLPSPNVLQRTRKVKSIELKNS
jgi:hypothetical protein